MLQLTLATGAGVGTTGAGVVAGMGTGVVASTGAGVPTGGVGGEGGD